MGSDLEAINDVIPAAEQKDDHGLLLLLKMYLMEEKYVYL